MMLFRKGPIASKFVWLGMVLSVALWVLPWKLRRKILELLFDYEISPKAYIGYSVVVPTKLRMDDHAVIGHLNFIRRQEVVTLAEHATIGHLNTIGGYGIRTNSMFASQERVPSLILGRHAAITSRHLFDCTDRVEIGEFSLIAGYRSQFLTHTPDFSVPLQKCAPIIIGRYVFVGSGTIMLKGVVVSDYCLVSALSLVKRSLVDSYWVYEGVPAVPVKKLDDTLGFFCRTQGRID